MRLETLRFVVSNVRNLAIEKYGAKGEQAVTDNDVLTVIKKLVKSHKESLEAFQNAHRLDLISKEQAELDILETYLPKEIDDNQLKIIISQVINESKDKNFGLLMGQSMKKVNGLAGGDRVSKILKELLSN